MKQEGVSSLARYKFQNYMKEIYYDSDTTMALLSGAPFDDPSWWLLSNEQIAKAREMINDFAGSRRLLAHSVITPKQPGWMDEVDKAIAVYKTGFVESPTRSATRSRRRIPGGLTTNSDVSVLRQGGESRDHNAMYPQRSAAARLRKSFAGVWEYATAWDIGKAAKDWPQMNFVIYHSALRPFLDCPIRPGPNRGPRPYPVGHRSRGNSAEVRGH